MACVQGDCLSKEKMNDFFFYIYSLSVVDYRDVHSKQCNSQGMSTRREVLRMCRALILLGAVGWEGCRTAGAFLSSSMVQRLHAVTSENALPN